MREKFESGLYVIGKTTSQYAGIGNEIEYETTIYNVDGIPKDKSSIKMVYDV